MTKFKVNKIYRNTTKCGNYLIVHDLCVEEIDGKTIKGYINHYNIVDGKKVDSLEYKITTKIKKELGENYQFTSDLDEVYKATNEVEFTNVKETKLKNEIAIIDEKLENASKDNLSSEEYDKLLDRKEQLLYDSIFEIIGRDI